MRVGLLALPLFVVGTVAQAQAYQCTPPKGPIAIAKPIPDGPIRRVATTGYTLALSWSPEHCRFATTADRFQCSGKNGRFGLVLHGLWPEGKGMNWPQWCPTARRPSPALIRQMLCLTPSAALIEHEWAKHGSCMTRTPDAYFKAAKILYASLTLPDLDRLSRRKPLTAGIIREAFSTAFPAFKPNMVGLSLRKGGWLDEIRLCYNKDFYPARCTKGQYGPADAASAKIWRGL